MRQLFIFNLLGTIIDPKDAYIPAFQNACKDFGFTPPDYSSIQLCLGNSRLNGIIEKFFPNLENGHRQSFAARCNELRDDYLSRCKIIPGVHQALKNLQNEDHVLACVTGVDQRVALKLVKDLDLVPLFGQHVYGLDFVAVENREISLLDAKISAIQKAKSHFPDLYATFVADSVTDIAASLHSKSCFLGVSHHDQSKQDVFQKKYGIPSVVTVGDLLPYVQGRLIAK